MKTTRASILVVDDEAAMARALADNLVVEGYGVTTVGDGVAALEAQADQVHDLVILDVMMPVMDGWETLRRLRRAGDRVPVLMLTALGAERDKVKGLDAGADDYLPKPFGLLELLARVRALLRRAPPQSTPEMVAMGTLTIDLVRRSVAGGREGVTLTATEAAILGHLAAVDGAVVSREEIIDCCLPEGDRATNRTVDMHIRRLREKLEDDPGVPRFILTVFGEGYRWAVGPSAEA